MASSSGGVGRDLGQDRLGGLLDPGVIPAEGVAVAPQDLQLVAEVGAAGDVAGVGVLGDEPERLALTAASDHDRRVRPADRLRMVERLGELVVRPQERPVVSGPHLVQDPERLLQPLEPLLQRRERDTETEVLTLEPGRPDAAPGPTAGQDVERRDGLSEDAGVTVGDPGDERPEPDPLRDGGGEAKGGVALQHRVLSRAAVGQLEEVVHHPEGVEPGGLGPPGQLREARGRSRPSRPRT